MQPKNIDKLVAAAMAIEAEEAKEAGALGYMARALTQATMPHKRVEGNEFTRKNGAFTLTILSPSDVGLPYGSIPRLLIAWLTTEAVRTRERTLCLGNTLSSFMREIGLVPTGGRWGSITRLREQTKRLFTSSISCTYETSGVSKEAGFRIADTHELWWYPRTASQSTLIESSVTLSESFFNEIINHPIPIDLRVLKALKQSPMALDIYCWLTYRMSYLKNETEIPWGLLQMQFGADYKDLYEFRRNFVKQLKFVLEVYQDARASDEQNGLILYHGKPHIPRIG
jgi:hypothetical protein